MNRSDALVLFDIDGTLMRGAGKQHKQALLDGIRTVTGVSADFDGVDTAGRLDRDLIIALLRAKGYSQRRADKALQRVMMECQSTYTSTVCAVDFSPFVCAGIRDFVTEVKRRGGVLGLVTGNLTQIGWRKVELAGLREYFSVGAFAEDGRTRARLARVAANRAKKQRLVTAGCRITLIGDHANDVAAAKANGYRSIAVATGVTPLDQLQAEHPDYLVPNLTELSVDVVF